MRTTTTRKLDRDVLLEELELDPAPPVVTTKIGPRLWEVEVPPEEEWSEPPAKRPPDWQPELVAKHEVVTKEQLDTAVEAAAWAAAEVADRPLELAALATALDATVGFDDGWLDAPVPQAALDAALDAHDPVLLTTDRRTISPDGATAALITYRRRADKAPAQVAFTVNGQAVQVATTEGVAELEVTSDVPRLIQVDVAGQTVIVEARHG